MIMSLPESLSLVYRDLFTLGLVKSDRPLDIDDSDIMRAVTATHSIGSRRVPRHPELLTNYGKMLHEAMAANIEFGAHPLVHDKQIFSCKDAEGYFAQNVISRDDGWVPIIITEQDVPIAVIKGLGEPTAYVLRSSYARGLIEKTISLPKQLIDPRFLPNDVPANVLPLDKQEHYTPLRFAATALPPDTRAHYKAAVLFDHESILDQAEHLARIGRPVLESQISYAIEATASDL